MYLEERVAALEAENKELREKVSRLELCGMTRFVTCKELAEIMKCSVQNVHRKIETGQIKATRRLGDQRIPMNQFLEEDQAPKRPAILQRMPEKREKTMAEQIFG